MTTGQSDGVGVTPEVLFFQVTLACGQFTKSNHIATNLFH